MTDKCEYFECSCHSPEHALKFVLDEDPKFPALYAYVFLSEKKFLGRVWDAVKHVLGYKCRYGHFDEFILQKVDCDRLIGLVGRFKELDNSLQSPEGRGQ